MIQCSYCQCSFENIQLLLNHIANFHGSLKHFKCFFDNCNRVYSLYQSFRKHILHKHTLFSTSEPSIVESPVLPNECHSSDFQNDKHSDVYYSSDSDSDVSIIDDVTDSLEEINTFGDDTEEMHIGPTWEKNLKIISLKYTASLYNLKKVSRKCVVTSWGGDGVRTMTISGVLAPSPPTYRRALRPGGLRRNGVNCAGQVDWLFGIEEEKKRCVVSSWDRQPDSSVGL